MDPIEIIGLWTLFHVFDGICWFTWRIVNFVSDRYLRRDGWDSEEEWAPMVDYIPFWRLFRGVEDLGPRSVRKRI